MDYVVTFRDPAAGALLDAGSGPALVVVAARYQFGAPGAGVSISITGLARKIDAVDLSLVVGPAAPLSAQATPDATTGYFLANFGNVVAVSGDVITLTAAAHGGGPSDRASWRIDREEPAITSGNLAGIPAARQNLVAGVPDRVLRTRFFVPLVSDLLPFAGFQTIAVLNADGTMETVDVQAAQDASKDGLTKLLEQGRNGDIKAPDFANQQVALMANTMQGMAKADVPEKRGRNLSALRAAMGKRWGAELQSLRGLAPRYMALSTKSDAPSNPSTLVFGPIAAEGWNNRWTAVVRGAVRRKIQDLPFGLVFTDRLRFQPAGLVVGEKVFALSLTPGEEVQLRQVVETRRQTVLEDVKDRDTEQQLTLSSTWTTEITDSLKENQSRQNSSTEGLSGNADLTQVGEAIGIPLPIQIGATASFSASTADNDSQEHSRKQNQEATVTATSRMRAQHRIRFEVTNETSSSLTTTRTLRNPNRQRAVTYLFHKLYRKEKVSLERIGAQLCLRLAVRDPAALTRASFVAGIDGLDPNNPANYHASAPSAVTANWKVQLDGPDANVAGTVSEDSTDSGYDTAAIPAFKLRKKFGVVRAGDIPPGYLLADQPTMTIDQFSWGTETHYGRAEFEQLGGRVDWTTQPALSDADPSGALRTLLVWEKDGGHFRSMSQVKATFTSTWVPSAAELAQYNASKTQARQALEQNLQDNVALIYSLRDIAVSEFPGVVLGAAASQYFSADAALQNLAAIFDLGGMYLDLLPYWATSQGRAVYSKLHNRLSLLPVTLTPSDILVPELTAQLARVYLPIREGMEAEAGQILEDWPADAYRSAVGDLAAIRQRDYAPVPHRTDKPEDICGPHPPLATPLGDAAWKADWEKPVQSFKVLTQWAEFIPTDGVHLEMKLSDTVASDEALTNNILRNLP